MSVAEVVFYLLGGLAVGSAILVVSSRNPVASLLFLVLSFFCLAGLFATLGAHFLAAIQILVYAGAILVLFLFVIMLLNLGVSEEAKMRLPRWPALALAVAAGIGFVVFLALAIAESRDTVSAAAAEEAPRSLEPGEDGEVVDAAAEEGGELDELALDEVGTDARQPEEALVGTTEALGVGLFRDYLLPFEVTSLLLLVAMVGAVVLAKRER